MFFRCKRFSFVSEKEFRASTGNNKEHYRTKGDCVDMVANNSSVWRTLGYIILGIIVLSVAFAVLGWLLHFALRMLAMLFSLVFVVGFIYVLYIIVRGVLRRT